MGYISNCREFHSRVEEVHRKCTYVRDASHVRWLSPAHVHSCLKSQYVARVLSKPSVSRYVLPVEFRERETGEFIRSRVIFRCMSPERSAAPPQGTWHLLHQQKSSFPWQTERTMIFADDSLGGFSPRVLSGTLRACTPRICVPRNSR